MLSPLIEPNLHSRRQSIQLRPSQVKFLDDPRSEMTWGRRIALSLSNLKCYNPLAGQSSDISDVEVEDDETLSSTSGRSRAHHHPRLERSWAYFEHVTLPRYIAHDDEHGGMLKCVRDFLFGYQLERAEPGEVGFKTKMYSPWYTPLSQMGDFGLGIGLYFSSLRDLFMILLIAGLISIPNVLYFASDQYTNTVGVEQEIGFPGLAKYVMLGSAICTDQEWKACPDCVREDFMNDIVHDDSRFAWVENGNDTLTFALKNECDGARFIQGMVNWIAILFIFIGIMELNNRQLQQEIEFDEDEQTATDYSIRIQNPPKDASDPEEFKAFFEQFPGVHVTCCTVCLSNDLLVRSLVERREYLRQLELLLPDGSAMDVLSLARLSSEVEYGRSDFRRFLGLLLTPLGLLVDIPEVYGKIIVVTARIRGLAQRNYPTTSVFVSFETEAAQRTVLSALSVGKIHSLTGNKRALSNPALLFRGNRVLDIFEPQEPDSIRWQDLNASIRERIKTIFLTFMANFGAMILAALCVVLVNNKKSAYAAITISLFNAIFPVFNKLITSFESHPSESGRQTSLYIKIALFRMFNTTLVVQIVAPFTSILSEGTDDLLYTIYLIFFADIITTNAIQLTDIFGHVQRHILGPRAATQERMNLNFRGTQYELAERYTSMTKMVFLAIWYCALFPIALFLGAFALFLMYNADKFSIMRTWSPSAKLGASISNINRNYMMPVAVALAAIMSSYWWAQFPYDSICVNTNSTVAEQYVGNYTAQMDNHPNVNITIDQDDPTYRFCDQYLIAQRKFPALPTMQPKGGEWMTEEQIEITEIFGWTSVAISGIVLMSLLWNLIQHIIGFFKGGYEPTGNDMGVNFTNVTSISTYIPQVRSDHFSYPLLACDIDGLDEELFDWDDPDRSYDYYNLTKDVEEILMGRNVAKEPGMNVFTKVHHWPPGSLPRAGGIMKKANAQKDAESYSDSSDFSPLGQESYF